MNDRSSQFRTRELAVMSLIAPLIAGVVAGGCSMRYLTPGRGVAVTSLATSDFDIEERMLRQPAASFPAHLAVVRVQASGYRSHGSISYGHGNYSVVTAGDMERDEHFDRLEQLPMVADVARLNRLLIPAKLESDKELRLAAASLKADLVFVYTVDTVFRIDEHDVGPLRLITLGMLPINEAHVTSVASAALFDVRTGYVYSVAESTARETQLANAWTSKDAIDAARRRAERRAFEGLLDEFTSAWTDVVAEYAGEADQPAVSKLGDAR